MLVAAAECSLRFSNSWPAKLSSELAVAIAITLLGVATSRKVYISTIASLLAFAAYLTASTYRFPGLLKEPYPYSVLQLLTFSVRTLAISSLAVAGVWASMLAYRAAGRRSQR